MYYTKKIKRYHLFFAVMVILMLMEIVFCAAIGSADIPFYSTVKVFGTKIPIFDKIIDIKDIKQSHITIITDLRLPRVILSGLTGSALSVTGVSFQSIFKNPLADPYIIGASAGGALGAAIAIILRPGLSGFGSWITSIFAFAGAIAATYAVYMFGKVKGKVSITTIILSGIAMNSMLSAILSIILLFNKEQMNMIIFWTMGSFSHAGWQQVVIVLPPVTAVIIAAYIYSKDLNIMLLGEESAHHLGVNTDVVKKAVLFAGAFITGITVSVSGIIGFVGIVIPHMARIIIGPDNRTMIPFTAVGGAMFLMGIDAISRSLMHSHEIPVGILTAAVGGPFFIYLLLKNKRKII